MVADVNKINSKTRDKSQESQRQLQTSHRQQQKTTDKSQTTKDESQSRRRQLQTSHKQPQMSPKRLLANHR